MGYSKNNNAYVSDKDKNNDDEIENIEKDVVSESKETIVKDEEFKLSVEENDKDEELELSVDNDINIGLRDIAFGKESYVLNNNNNKNKMELFNSYERDKVFRQYVNRRNKNRNMHTVNGMSVDIADILSNINNRLMYLEYKSGVSYEVDTNNYMNYEKIFMKMREK